MARRRGNCEADNSFETFSLTNVQPIFGHGGPVRLPARLSGRLARIRRMSYIHE